MAKTNFFVRAAELRWHWSLGAVQIEEAATNDLVVLLFHGLAAVGFHDRPIKDVRHRLRFWCGVFATVFSETCKLEVADADHHDSQRNDLIG
ncbi:hypothetical protein [uncultured Ruegeria sp.]|uniref:hypothetical protein n=1 Tax=uncultured Ruegeria sp. TaxID=259304 RepID=UPI00260692AA|nr:hypothetical protein [uncultured Ruegeria sp.]